MISKTNSTIITAICTAAGLIALAFYQHYEGPIAITPEAFYIAAALILLGSVVYSWARRKGCTRRAPIVN